MSFTGFMKLIKKLDRPEDHYKSLMVKKSISFIVLLVLVGISGCVNPVPTPTPTPTETITPTPTPSTCDQSLWNHVYHPSRLKVIEECKTVSGVVENFVKEADGDIHMRLDVDDKSLINQANIDGQHGYLVVEPICQNTPTQTDAIQPCQGYTGPYFDMSQYVGKHVAVTGSYVSDLEHNGWNEIHPITSIKEI